MSKDELQFISDLAEKHQLSFKKLLALLGVGVTRSAYLFNMQEDFENERKMFDLDMDIAHAVGVVPLAEKFE